MKHALLSAAAVLLFATVRSAAGQDVSTAVATDSGPLVLDVQGSGSDSTKRVGVNIQRNGSTQRVSGAADVAGFPIIDGGQWGNVDWKVDGSRVTGTVVNEKGEIEGTYEGTITATGVSGKFTHVDGRVGLWSWDGPPPAGAASDQQ